MRWTYDLDVEALYVYLTDGAKIVGQDELAEGVFVDLDPDGRATGLEVIRPTTAPWRQVMESDCFSDEDRMALASFAWVNFPARGAQPTVERLAAPEARHLAFTSA